MLRFMQDCGTDGRRGIRRSAQTEVNRTFRDGRMLLRCAVSSHSAEDGLVSTSRVACRLSCHWTLDLSQRSASGRNVELHRVSWRGTSVPHYRRCTHHRPGTQRVLIGLVQSISRTAVFRGFRSHQLQDKSEPIALCTFFETSHGCCWLLLSVPVLSLCETAEA